MKTLKEYVCESSKTYTNNVDSKLKKICANMIKSTNLKSLYPINDQDPNRFDLSKKNEELFIANFNDPDLKALTTEEYYNISHKEKFTNLSSTEKAKFDRENGDIIVVDENNAPVYFIDIKVSDKYLGAVNLGSLAEFNEDGVYVCVCSSTGKYNIVSHKSLIDAVKENPNLLNPVVENNTYKGYAVKWEGEQLTSEYFVKGNDIEKFK